MLNCYIQPKISNKLTLFKDGIVLDQVYGDFPTCLWVLSLFDVIDFESSPTVHLDKQRNNQVPSFLYILFRNRHMELPIRNLMSELILSMPVHPAQLCVQLDEAIIAQGFIVSLLADCVSILLKEFICKEMRDD